MYCDTNKTMCQQIVKQDFQHLNFQEKIPISRCNSPV